MGPHHDDGRRAAGSVRDDPSGQLLDADQIGLLDESLRLVEDRADRVVGYFYAALFVAAPQLRSLFPAAMDAQRDRLFRALTSVVRTLDDPARVVPMLEQLGRDHRKFGVRPEHYDAVGDALVLALHRHAEDVWVPELEDAWRAAYAVMAETMQRGAREAASREPAWWRGEIIAHERRSDDLAVVLVRTDRPYDYEPGQYASIETPYRPRSWRTYSMATAPSADGILEFHVRALPHGWVSGPLVWRAQVGDQLRVGAPMGSLQVDQQSGRDVLMVAGGTGLATAKSLVDGMTRWNTARGVTLFFGARRAGDLYDMGPLHRMAAMNPWLTVVPVVSDDPSFSGEQGLLADAVARRGTWAEYDVFVAGSPAMTRATVARLRSLGVPAERVRHDSVEGLADDPRGTAQVIDLRRGRASRSTR